MTCREVHGRLADLGTGDLPRGARDFDRHLEECASCRTYVDSYVKTVALARRAMRADEEPEAPAELVNALLASLGRGPERPN